MSKLTSPAPAANRFVSLPASKERPASNACGVASTPEVTVERIRDRAFEIFLDRNSNGGSGDANLDWLQAERELKGCRANSTTSSDIEVKANARSEVLLASGK